MSRTLPAPRHFGTSAEVSWCGSVRTLAQRVWSWVAVNSTHGQLDTCIQLTRLRKSQLDTTEVDTGVNSTHIEQFNCSAIFSRQVDSDQNWHN